MLSTDNLTFWNKLMLAMCSYLWAVQNKNGQCKDMAAKASLSSETVEYYLFPSISSDVDANKQNEQLGELADSYLAYLSSYLIPYIWQNESFKLIVVDQSKNSDCIPPHLYGCTNFGDNIEDEWFIVFLIYQLTQHFDNLVARVIDSDGDFFLIEAADYLPKWMNPETTENRVYIYEGSLHILPQTRTPQLLTSLPTGTPKISDAVTAIRGFSKTTKSDKKIQSAILKRIGRFPEKIKEDHHRAHCFVPAAVAALLHVRPMLVSAAVNAFYLRDQTDLKACRAMKYFPPETRVMIDVVFTKCLYAQLMQQKYIPDKRTGWNLPSPNSSNFKAADLGMKLACGFEILLSNTKPVIHDEQSFCENIDWEMDPRWCRYFQSLKSKGYFRDELENSKLYNELLENAKTYYTTNMRGNEKKDISIGEEIHLLLSSLDTDVDHWRRKAVNIKPCDDDSWLAISPENLNSLLKDYGYKSTTDDDDLQEVTHISKTISSGLNDFVSHVSSHEGAEFPKLGKNNRDNRVTFDPDSFADAMQSILDFKVPEWDERSHSSSGMSDYSDENDEIDLSKPSGNKPVSSAPEFDDFSNEMQAYMEQMDRELATTTVGQSFERDAKPNLENKAPLAEWTEASKSDDIDDYQPVDVDLTALKNILQSYQSQQGLPGPASNLLESMGIQIPRDVETCD